MSNPHQHDEKRDNPGFEREDIGPRTVYVFLITLAIVVVAAVIVSKGIYHGLDRLDKYLKADQPAMSPMKPAETGDVREEDTPQAKERIENTFPKPLLEDDERNELTDRRMQEDGQLSSYGWVDQKAGTVHIPIARAMELIAERGLPVRQNGMNQTAPSAVAPVKATPSGKKAAASQSGN